MIIEVSVCSLILSASSNPSIFGISTSRIKISAIFPSSISYINISGFENSLILNSTCFRLENIPKAFFILSMSYLLSSQIETLNIWFCPLFINNSVSFLSIYIKEKFFKICNNQNIHVIICFPVWCICITIVYKCTFRIVFDM